MSSAALFPPVTAGSDAVSPDHAAANLLPASPIAPRVLAIAGSDPSGGAGIQADIKTISAHGGYAMAAITALTAQNTRGVQAIHVPPGQFLTEQLDALYSDITIDAVKIGMLGTSDLIAVVHGWLQRTRPPAVVLDPVMAATSGDSLLEPEARQGILQLLEHVHLVTPNLPELAALLAEPVATTWEEALEQGRTLACAHQVLVLVKGGHLPGEHCPDALVDAHGTVREFSAPRINTPNTHGTGCALSSAVAALQARGGDWGDSIHQAKEWLEGALKSSTQLQVGGGAGPVNHFHELWKSAPSAQGSAETAAPDNRFSGRLWEHCKPQRDAIFQLDFVRELSAGTLAPERFAYYLAQDALYLGAYARVLSRASALAPTLAEQRFWARSAQQCLQEELALHEGWSASPGAEAEAEAEAEPTALKEAAAQAGPTTRGYVEHLQSTAFTGGYGEVVAAVLPCFWIYAEVGRVLQAELKAERPSPPCRHPYAAWLDSYAAPGFAQATREAVAIMDAAAHRGSATERERMAGAFSRSVQLELEFFAAPHAHVSGVEPGIGD